MTRMAGSPARQCPAVISRVITSPDLGGGDRDLIVIGTQPHRIQHRRPRRAARLQRRDHRVRPARDHLRLPLPAPVDVTEQTARAGRRGRLKGRCTTSWLFCWLLCGVTIFEKTLLPVGTAGFEPATP